MDYRVIIKGKRAEDDGLEIEMRRQWPEQAWWDIPLPPCPDCGGDLVWCKAGYVPGPRKCLGLPRGGRPTNPMLDARVPLPDGSEYRGRDGYFPAGAVGKVARALFAERNTWPEALVADIDRELIRLLYRWTRLEYAEDGGCGSLFAVDARPDRVYLRRERFYPR